jgi:protein arginine N-methyltransferase 1
MSSQAQALRQAQAQAEERLAHGPFPLFAHAKMLGDDYRLSQFRRAIEAHVQDPEVVVDIGTGTGILAWYAAQCTTGEVVGIEAEGAACDFAERLLARSPGRRPRVHRGLSFGRPLDLEPDVVISETLGPIGLEENTVEILWEFCRRYPSVRRVIPASLRIMAQPVRSRALRDHYAELLGGFERAAHHGPAYGAMRAELEHGLAHVLMPVDVRADAEAVAAPSELASFELGRSRSSAFEASVSLPSREYYDGVCLYFESTLCDDVRITTSCLRDSTHWETFFVAAHPLHRTLRVGFDARERNYAVAWR